MPQRSDPDHEQGQGSCQRNHSRTQKPIWARLLYKGAGERQRQGGEFPVQGGVTGGRIGKDSQNGIITLVTPADNPGGSVFDCDESLLIIDYELNHRRQPLIVVIFWKS